MISFVAFRSQRTQTTHLLRFHTSAFRYTISYVLRLCWLVWAFRLRKSLSVNILTFRTTRSCQLCCFLTKLLPGVHVAIANPDTLGQCADSHLGEIWVSSPHNSVRFLGPFNINNNGTTAAAAAAASFAGGGFSMATTAGSSLSSGSHSASGGGGGGAYENSSVINCDPLHARFVAGDTERVYARTGFLGFVRRTKLTQSDGGTSGRALSTHSHLCRLKLEHRFGLFLSSSRCRFCRGKPRRNHDAPWNAILSNGHWKYCSPIS